MNRIAQKESISLGFSRIYQHYENLNKHSLIDKVMREQLYKHIERNLKPNLNILELNSGSGIDAVYFAGKGHKVLATDIAYGAKEYIESKAKKQKLDNLKFQNCSFTNVDELNEDFNYVFSNFGGLNCTDEFHKVEEALSKLLNTNAYVTFVIMGKYYPWDWVYLFKGKIKRAFIRLKKNGTIANIEGEQIHTFYHTPSAVTKIMSPHFEFVSSENLGVLYPSVNHTSITKHPKLIKVLIHLDALLLKTKIIPIGIGDYYIITFRKK